MEKNFRGKKLFITVDNLAHREGNPTRMVVNGVEREAGLIADSELQAENRITIIM